MNEIIKKNGINFGIITGIISILVTAIIYVINLELFTSAWIGVASAIISIVISVILLSKTKKELNNIFTFKDAFTTYFIAAVIGIMMSVVFNIILFNYIDPAAKDTLKELIIKYTSDMLHKFGSPQSTINDTIQKMKADDPFSTGKLLQGSILKILMSAVFGLILAAIFKSKTSYQE